jgi:hypothetical protein
VELFWLCWNNGIRMDLIWIPRELNQWADDLSKRVDVSDWSLADWIWKEVWEAFGPFWCDRFASAVNARLPVFCSLVHCTEVSYVEAFSRNWFEGKSWCHPLQI